MYTNVHMNTKDTYASSQVIIGLRNLDVALRTDRQLYTMFYNN